VRRFEPGETVVLRDVLRGAVWAARPATIVRDDADAWMFYLPIGNRWFGPSARKEDRIRLKAPGTSWTLRERRWTEAHVLSFAWPHTGYAVLHFWDASWTPRLWYVNVEAPLRRTELGFDTLDHDLDIEIEPDRSSWRWKDEDVVADGIRLGAYSERDAADFRHQAELGRSRVMEREPPFEREWSDWRPDPAWSVPVLPPGWDRVVPS
jgi:uncharacterized protein